MRSIKDFIFRNTLQKILAICFAIFIWAIAPAPNKNLTEVKFFVPVTYINLPRNLEIISEPQRTISVSVQIPRNELSQIHPSLFQAPVNLEDAVQGEHEYEITKDTLRTPPNVTVLEISPKVIKLKFEYIMEKVLPINPVFIGEPAKGYVREKVTLVPESIEVRGLRSILSKIEHLETRALKIDGIDSDLEMWFTIIYPDGIVATDPKPESYTATIKIGSEPINARFGNIPIGILNQTYVTRINPKHFNVMLRGPRSLMQNFSKQDIQAFINLQGYKPGNHDATPTLRLPPEIQIEKIWPLPIKVWVQNQKIDE
ncbi:hypothetical protein KKA14_16265 [bacterium]|nr:hypothetical protein [bacterium]